METSDSHPSKVLIITAFYAPDGDLEDHQRRVSEALSPLKKPGTTGAAVAYNLDSPLNFDLLRELDERFDLDPRVDDDALR